MYLLIEFLLCIALFGLSVYWEYRNQNKIPPNIRNDPETLNKWHMTRFNTFAVMPPIVEELIFRAVLIFFFTSLNVYSVTVIILISFLFAACHNTANEHRSVMWRWRNTGAIIRRIYLQFAGGVIFGLLAVWSQSLLLVVELHMLWNFVVWMRVQFALIDEGEFEFSQLYALRNKFSALRKT